jgi:putative transposase
MLENHARSFGKRVATKQRKELRVELTTISKEQLEELKALRTAIHPFLYKTCKKDDVENFEDRFGIKRTKLFKMLDRYREDPRLTTLIPRQSSAGLDTVRLDERVEKLICKIRNKEFKETPEISFKKLYEKTVDAHKKAKLEAKYGLKAPSLSTVTRRFKRLSQRERITLRDGSKIASEQNQLIRGCTPETQFPLQRIQVDHTLCDVWLVDSVTREPVGRPWITIVIDEYSRTILSFVLTFEYPSATTVAYALTRAVLKKEEWLRDLGVKTPWPFYGKPQSIYTDNGSDFCSKEARYGCAEWGIPEIEKRPKGSPQYGGIIERIIGVTMEETKMLPGKTARKIRKSGKQHLPDPKANAVLTIKEYEQWLAEFFGNQYHYREHSTLEMSPKEKWRRGIEGFGKEPGCGEPEEIHDPQKFFIDFLPLKRPKLQRSGFQWDYIKYSSEYLQTFLDEQRSVKYIVRQNPHDISRVYWWNPDTSKYYEIPCTNADLIGRTKWELKEAKRRNKEQGITQNQETIMAAIVQMDRLVANAKTKTQTQRKNQERKRQSAIKTNEHVKHSSEKPEPKAAKPFVPKNYTIEDM